LIGHSDVLVVRGESILKGSVSFRVATLERVLHGTGDAEKFGEVPLATHLSAGSYFFLEHTSFWSLLAMLFASVVLHTYAALRSPPVLAGKEEYFKLNSTEENVSIDVDFRNYKMVTDLLR
jgi:hypothetical protein